MFFLLVEVVFQHFLHFMVEVVFQHFLHLMWQVDNDMFQRQIQPNPMQSGWGEKYS